VSSRMRGVGTRLAELCRLYGVVVDYRDVAGRSCRPPRESLWAVLRGLGARLPAGRAPGEAEVRDALRVRRRELAERPVPPVVVAWDGRLPCLRLRVPDDPFPAPLALHVELAGGEERRIEVGGGGPVIGRREVEGRRLAVRHVRPERDGDAPLPPGLHGLRVAAASGNGSGPEIARAPLVSAPSRTWPAVGGAAVGADPAAWAVFLPLYALRARGTAGVGDYGALARLGGWAARRGASRLATLPLLPLFLDEPFDPSPYAPVSRLFWTELYLDLEDACDRADSRAARDLLRSDGFARRRAVLESRVDVDYRAAAALRRDLLDRVMTEPGGVRGLSERVPALGRFLRERRGAADFAAFLAACERHRAPWRGWPTPARDAPLRREGLVAGRDFDPAARDRHLVGQWLAVEQVDAVVERGRREGFGLFLDLPLSVHPDGYDVWRERELFAEAMSVGAPPDAFFAEGQDWGFPPPVPHAMRRSGYAYLRASLAHSMGPARALRIDHVMGLHRLFWIPRGAKPEDGVYVRYPSREQYALLSLASHRHGAEVIGEDLGTVPEAVRGAMDRHGVGRLFVVPFELDPDRSPVLREPPPGSVAMVDTHDTWPFAGWWDGADIEGRVGLGMLDPSEVDRALERRALERRALVDWLAERGLIEAGEGATPGGVLTACLEALGRAEAGTVVASLEDLWLETRPQNIPGAPGAARSWRRRAGVPLEELDDRVEVTAALQRLAKARRQARDAREHGEWDEDGSRR